MPDFFRWSPNEAMESGFGFLPNFFASSSRNLFWAAKFSYAKFFKKEKLLRSFLKFYWYFVAKNNIALAKCSGTLFRKVIKLVE